LPLAATRRCGEPTASARVQPCDECLLGPQPFPAALDW